MSSVIRSIIRTQTGPPPGETVAVFSDKHVGYGYMLGGRWYGTDRQPLRWKKIARRESV